MTEEEQKNAETTFRLVNSVSGYNKNNGIKVTYVDCERSEVEVELTEKSLNPHGIAHGGLIYSICDVATGCISMASGKRCVTQNSTIYFLSPGKGKKLIAKGRRIRMGKTTGLYVADVYDDNGTHVATCSEGYYFLGQDQKI